MSRPHVPPPWFVRLGRSGAAVLLGLAILIWVTPVNVRSRSGFLFGCGSPADPRGGGDLVVLVCGTQLGTVRAASVALLGAAAVVLLLSEFVAPRRPSAPWIAGLVAVSPLAMPLMIVGVMSLFVPVGGTSPTGEPFRCGIAAAPATDEMSRLVCGQLAQTRLALGLGAVALGAGLLAGGVYVVRTSPPTGAPVDGSSAASPSIGPTGTEE